MEKKMENEMETGGIGIQGTELKLLQWGVELLSAPSKSYSVLTAMLR